NQKWGNRPLRRNLSLSQRHLNRLGRREGTRASARRRTAFRGGGAYARSEDPSQGQRAPCRSPVCALAERTLSRRAAATVSSASFVGAQFGFQARFPARSVSARSTSPF